MSDEDDTRDHALSRLYREGAWPEPSRQIDQAILAASRRASRERHPFLWRFAPPFAIAATVVLTSAIVLKVYREQPGVLEPSVQEKPAASARQFTPEPKEAEAKPAPAPEPQAAPTPPGFSSSMDTAEAARLERAQRDLGFKEPSPAGARPAADSAPAPKPASPQPLKKEATQPSAPSAERRADAPQAPTKPAFSVFGASPSVAPTPAQNAAPTPAPAPTQAARAPTGKPAQLVAPTPPAPSGETAAAAQAPAPASPATGVGLFQAPAAESRYNNAIEAAAVKAERTPQVWIDDIRKLMKEGKSEEAGEEISKFKKRYPDYVLPEDLR